MQVAHDETIIELSGVSFSYNTPELIIKDVSFSVHRGDYLGIIGPNGGGKTTLLKIILGLLRPTAGTVRVFGKNPRSFHERYKIGYVAQRATSFDRNFPATVEEVVAMGTYGRRGLFHASNREDALSVQEALERVEMLPYRRNRIGDLSGGQQQRVFIARALAAKPELIVLDEPTVGVDERTQRQFYALLRKLNEELQLTLVLATHELNIIARQATEIACINQSLTCFATPDEVVAQGGIEKLYGRDTQYFGHHHEHAS